MCSSPAGSLGTMLNKQAAANCGLISDLMTLLNVAAFAGGVLAIACGVVLVMRRAA